MEFIKYLVLSRMGIIISLSGVDNAGKSTQSKLLVAYFKKNKKKVIVTQFAFGYFLLKSVIAVLRKKTGSPKSGPVKRNTNLLYKLWFLPAFFDIWLGYCLYLLPLKDKYDVIITDRFYTDIWVNLLYYGYIPKLGYDVFLPLLPKPDRSFIFMLKPSIGYKRINDEFPLSYYQEQVKLYKLLSKSVYSTVINAERTPALIHKELVKLLKEYV